MAYHSIGMKQLSSENVARINNSEITFSSNLSLTKISWKMLNCTCSEPKVNCDAFKISILYLTVQLHVLGDFSPSVLWRVNPTEEAAWEGKLISPQYLSGRARDGPQGPCCAYSSNRAKKSYCVCKNNQLIFEPELVLLCPDSKYNKSL